MKEFWVAYLLQFHETQAAPHLLALDLSREGRVALAAVLTEELRLRADVYRNDPQRRLAPGSDRFQVIFSFRDPVNRVRHRLRLIISDAAASYGILRIVYADGGVQPT